MDRHGYMPSGPVYGQQDIQITRDHVSSLYGREVTGGCLISNKLWRDSRWSDQISPCCHTGHNQPSHYVLVEGCISRYRLVVGSVFGKDWGKDRNLLAAPYPFSVTSAHHPNPVEDPFDSGPGAIYWYSFCWYEAFGCYPKVRRSDSYRQCHIGLLPNINGGSWWVLIRPRDVACYSGTVGF